MITTKKYQMHCILRKFIMVSLHKQNKADRTVSKNQDLLKLVCSKLAL